MSVYGFGNALLDVLIQVNDKDLAEMNRKKGDFKGANAKEISDVLDRFKDHPKVQCAGGGEANTMKTLGFLGTDAHFLCRLGKDESGDFYVEHMRRHGVTIDAIRTDTPTGTCLCLITPDGQRTFLTYTGASEELNPNDFKIDVLADRDMVYFTGFALYGENQRACAQHIVQEAGRLGKKLAFDAAAPLVVKKRRDIVTDLLTRHVDLAFFNEDEAAEFTGLTQGGSDLVRLATTTGLSRLLYHFVYKWGADGALAYEDGIAQRIPAHKTNAIDTTGAGDSFAAGYIHGLLKGYDVHRRGALAAKIASIVVSQVGTELRDEHRTQLAKYV